MFFRLALLFLAVSASAQTRFEVSWDKPLDGRVLLILARRNPPEPRFQVSEMVDTQQIFGVDVGGARSAVIDPTTLGYPLDSLARVPAGEYFVQAVLNVYETFHRADGHTVKLPMDRGEGQHWNRKPGNLYSEPVRVRLDPASSEPIRLVLSKQIPEVPKPADTKYVHHMKIESKLLSAFWGRPMSLGAIVVTPEGFDEHPDERYPVLYYQNHFTATFPQLRNDPRPAVPGRPPAVNRFYEAWSSGKLPKMLIVIGQDPNPYYDDSYAVNSANLGPYGDALVTELYPEVERRFRGIGQGWARAVYGGSTGGWRAMALQVFYPDFFNGAWIDAPDPIDFRAFGLINLYEDANAFHRQGDWMRVPIPMARDQEGGILTTMEDAIRYELVLGTKSRSGEQFDIWQAVYGPVGPDGYPAPVFDPRTGVVDRKVADYWKEHYDLARILRDRWPELGPKVAGKLHFLSGVTDAFYLERAVKLAQQFLEKTTNPPYGGSVEFIVGGGHGGALSGQPPPFGGLTFHERVLQAMADWMSKSAPPGGK